MEKEEKYEDMDEEEKEELKEHHRSMGRYLKLREEREKRKRLFKE